MRIDQLITQYREYLRHERGLAEASIRGYTTDLMRLASDTGSIPVQDITLDVLRAYVRNMSKAGLSPATIRRRIHSLNTFFTWLFIEGHVSEVVSKKLHVPKKKTKAPEWLNFGDYKLFTETPARDALTGLAWGLLAYLGLRRGEVLKLQWSAIKGDVIAIYNSKGTLDRQLPMPKPLKELVVKAMNERSNNPLVFPGNDGLGWRPHAFDRAFKSHLRQAGLDVDKYTPHSLRHTVMTHLALKGVPLHVIARILGHKHLSTVQVYVHMSHANLEDAINQNPVLLGSAS